MSNKYDGSTHFTLEAAGYVFPNNWRLRNGWDVVVMARINDHRPSECNPYGKSRVVAWCPTKAAAHAAWRLLSGKCEKP